MNLKMRTLIIRYLRILKFMGAMRAKLFRGSLILGVQARLISSVEASRHVFGLTSPLQPLPILSAPQAMEVANLRRARAAVGSRDWA